jgi:hypothetical protein
MTLQLEATLRFAASLPLGAGKVMLRMRTQQSTQAGLAGVVGPQRGQVKAHSQINLATAGHTASVTMAVIPAHPRGFTGLAAVVAARAQSAATPRLPHVAMVARVKSGSTVTSMLAAARAAAEIFTRQDRAA